MTAVDEAMAAACAGVPGLVQGVLVLLPDAYVIGSVGAARASEQEPLVRAVARAFAADGPSGRAGYPQLLIAVEDHFVVAQRGRAEPRLALAAVCTREVNLALVQIAARAALAGLEASIDLGAWVSP